MFGIVTLISFLSMHQPSLPPSAPRYDAASVRTAIEEHLPVVGQCYALHVGHGARASHRLRLRFSVAADGRISSAEVIHDGLPRGTARCIERDVRSWQLPAPGEAASLEYTFLFR